MKAMLSVLNILHVFINQPIYVSPKPVPMLYWISCWRIKGEMFLHGVQRVKSNIPPLNQSRGKNSRFHTLIIASSLRSFSGDLRYPLYLVFRSGRVRFLPLSPPF